MNHDLKPKVTIALAGMLLWTAVASGQQAGTANLNEARSLGHQLVRAIEAGDGTFVGSYLAQEAQPAAVGSDGLDQQSDPDSNLWAREKLTGNWCGMRDGLAAAGLTIDFGATYVFQGVAAGGFDGRFFDAFSDEGNAGNTFSGDMRLGIDTGKAGLWQSGFFNFRLQGRAGRSVVQRAGSVSAVNNDALFPNVLDEFDGEAVAKPWRSPS